MSVIDIDPLNNFLTNTYLPGMDKVDKELATLFVKMKNNEGQYDDMKRQGKIVGAVGAAGAVLLSTVPPRTKITTVGVLLSSGVLGIGMEIEDSAHRQYNTINNVNIRNLNELLKTYYSLTQQYIRIATQFAEILRSHPNYRKELPFFLKTLEDLRKISHDKTGDELVSREELREGDHIYRTISKCAGLVTHHGICIVHNGEIHVVDFGQSYKKQASTDKEEVVRKALDEFLGGQSKIYRRNYGGLCRSVDETVRMAMHAIDGNLLGWNYKYNLLTNNCEDFANFLKIGEVTSTQAHAFLHGMSNAPETVNTVITCFKLFEMSKFHVGTAFGAVLGAVGVVANATIALTMHDIVNLKKELVKGRPNIETVQCYLTQSLGQRSCLAAGAGELACLQVILDRNNDRAALFDELNGGREEVIEYSNYQSSTTSLFGPVLQSLALASAATASELVFNAKKLFQRYQPR